MNRTIYGDCRQSMKALAAQGVRVQMCVTSPPYFGLRDYGADGQLGLEKTPAEYVAAMVEVFAGVRDLLADDGVLWLNLGDSYNGYMANQRGTGLEAKRQQSRKYIEPGAGLRTDTVKNKDLIGIPWRVAFALQEAGWYLRQDVIWAKPNPMPESVTDRCTKAHEYLFLLAKSERYYFDADAIKEDAVGQTPNTGNRSKRDSFKRDGSKRAQVIPGQTVGTHRPDRDESQYDITKRNRRSVWNIPVRPYRGAHFATFPPELITPCILAGSRPGDKVLDPFMGSGTTAQVAQSLGRNWLGCELNPEYAPLQLARLGTVL